MKYGFSEKVYKTSTVPFYINNNLGHFWTLRCKIMQKKQQKSNDEKKVKVHVHCYEHSTSISKAWHQPIIILVLFPDRNDTIKYVLNIYLVNVSLKITGRMIHKYHQQSPSWLNSIWCYVP